MYGAGLWIQTIFWFALYADKLIRQHWRGLAGGHEQIPDMAAVLICCDGAGRFPVTKGAE